MELVVNEEQVLKNLAVLDRKRRLAGGDGGICRDLIKNGKCYLSYLTASGIAFAPSRFIGYVGNEIQAHGSNQDKHGSRTNDALSRIYGAQPVPNEILQLAFEKFCFSTGVRPNRDGGYGAPRKFWITDEVSDVIIKDQEEQVTADAKLTETQKRQVILARIGQGAFRKKLIEHWGACAATGCSQIDILKASHIKPWSESSNAERLDVFNGLLLSPSLDALFDKGYVSFDEGGRILISPHVSDHDRQILNCSAELKVKLSPKHHEYLAWHRGNLFGRSSKVRF
ncbi:HNH endonuclease [Pseudomonas sp. SZ57]|uniref:HNH endonuclease n=1 Tax=Pseudomonas TaxID=286 RepID=UPI000F02F4D4|nr:MULTISPECIES: HNH endonuclease [Pseudomonas]MCF5164186.1 HNH endonuclease [Pseudomonas congelans]MQQ35284.1 HNH endonuclease [Pseudomonas sp. SZ57]